MVRIIQIYIFAFCFYLFKLCKHYTQVNTVTLYWIFIYVLECYELELPFKRSRNRKYRIVAAKWNELCST